MFKKIANIIIFGGVAMLLGFLGLLILDAVQADRATQEFRETQVARFGDMTTLCENVEGENSGDFLIEGDERPLILLTGSTDVHPIQESLPPDRKPANSTEVDVVLCVQGQGQGALVEYGRCPYEDTDKVVIRYRADPEVILIDPANGARIVSGTVVGGDPGGCPFSVQDNNRDESVFGPVPSAVMVLDWLELQQIQMATRDWGDFLSMCESVPVPDASLSGVTGASTLLFLLNGTQDVHPWQVQGEREWSASGPEDIDYVVCAPPIDDDNTETRQVQTCQFMISSGGNFRGMRDIPLLMRSARTVIVDPASGDGLAELIVDGSLPTQNILNNDGCPQNIGADEFEGIYGLYPNRANFQVAFSQQFISGER